MVRLFKKAADLFLFFFFSTYFFARLGFAAPSAQEILTAYNRNLKYFDFQARLTVSAIFPGYTDKKIYLMLSKGTEFLKLNMIAPMQMETVTNREKIIVRMPGRPPRIIAKSILSSSALGLEKLNPGAALDLDDSQAELDENRSDPAHSIFVIKVSSKKYSAEKTPTSYLKLEYPSGRLLETRVVGHDGQETMVVKVLSHVQVGVTGMLFPSKTETKMSISGKPVIIVGEYENIKFDQGLNDSLFQ